MCEANEILANNEVCFQMHEALLFQCGKYYDICIILPCLNANLEGVMKHD